MVVGVIGTLRNFMELYVWGKSSGTLWNFIMGLMERNNYAAKSSETEAESNSTADAATHSRLRQQSPCTHPVTLFCHFWPLTQAR